MATAEFSFEAIGTHWQVDVYDLGFTPHQDLLQQIKRRIDIFDKHYSRFRADSLVTEIATRAGEYTLPADAKPLLDLYRQLYELTGGAFTPLIGQVLVEAGYDAQYSLQPKVLHQPPTWAEALEYTFPKLRTRQPVLLDFGAACKGYLIDLVAQVLEQNHIHSFCIDAGGDILYRPKAGETLRVGLENPNDLNQVIGVASLCRQSICGSAGNRRVWAGFHHTINPHTLTSPQHLLATWVVADTTMVADALATCLYFVPAATLAQVYDFEYLVLYPDFSIEKSNGFTAELFTT